MPKFNEIEVQQGEWRHLGGAGTLFTDNLETCIGVAVWSKEDRTALLGHFEAPGIKAEDSPLNEMVRAIGDLSINRGSKAWIGGASLITPELTILEEVDEEVIEIANAEIIDMREHTTNVIKAAVGPIVWPRIDWVCREPGVVGYSINVANGSYTVSWKKYRTFYEQ